jgi:hypothetical protein
MSSGTRSNRSNSKKKAEEKQSKAAETAPDAPASKNKEKKQDKDSAKADAPGSKNKQKKQDKDSAKADKKANGEVSWIVMMRLGHMCMQVNYRALVHVKNLKDTSGKRVIFEATGTFSCNEFDNKKARVNGESRHTAFIKTVLQPLITNNTIGKEWLAHANEMQCYATHLSKVEAGFKRESDVRKLAPRVRPINTEKTPFTVIHCL